ncbi:MAG: rRNA pseudouridine synthase [Oscillospiraceae bacterium]|nr:rRNA pseudouridine synthase [Oscillospiraceae bacterium]
MERLDKRLAATGRWSRKEARELIRAGRVSVGGAPCRAPESKVDECAPVLVDGAAIGADRPVYLMLHKPAGVVSSTAEPGERTVLDLLGEEYQNIGLFPAGRLDKDTEGLLLLTNDGALAHRLLSPRSHVDKVYYVEVDGALDQDDVQAARTGMTLGDGTECLPAELELLSSDSAHITLREGKYHQVKRMMASRGKPVRYLKRVRFGPLTLDAALPKGGWRALNEGELEAILGE